MITVTIFLASFQKIDPANSKIENGRPIKIYNINYINNASFN
jgi:hypothetical protein